MKSSKSGHSSSLIMCRGELVFMAQVNLYSGQPVSCRNPSVDPFCQHNQGLLIAVNEFLRDKRIFMLLLYVYNME